MKTGKIKSNAVNLVGKLFRFFNISELRPK